MALTKEFEYDCEVRGPYKAVQVRKATIIKDGDDEISRTYHRHVLQCRTKTGVTYNEDGTVDNAGTWGDTDISGEDASVQAVCNAVWTSTVKSAYETFADAQAAI